MIKFIKIEDHKQYYARFKETKEKIIAFLTQEQRDDKEWIAAIF